MKKEIHNKLQVSIDKMQKHQDEMSHLICNLCGTLDKIVKYKHTEKKVYRILINDNGKYYDADDLIEQAEQHVQLLDKGE